MEDKKPKIDRFENLLVWHESQDLAVQVYKLVENFPAYEMYGLSSQLRRASSSISANIAEGFGRRGAKEKLQFYSVAYGSALEVKNFLYLAGKLGYMQDLVLAELLEKTELVQKLLNAFMRPLK